VEDGDSSRGLGTRILKVEENLQDRTKRDDWSISQALKRADIA
jgi:hypothetical protein